MSNAIVINELDDVLIPIKVRADHIIFENGVTTKQANFEKKVAKYYFDKQHWDDVYEILLTLLIDDVQVVIYNCAVFDQIFYSDEFEIHPYSQKDKKIKKKKKDKQLTIFESLGV